MGLEEEMLFGVFKKKPKLAYGVVEVNLNPNEWDAPLTRMDEVYDTVSDAKSRARELADWYREAYNSGSDNPTSYTHEEFWTLTDNEDRNPEFSQWWYAPAICDTVHVAIQVLCIKR